MLSLDPVFYELMERDPKRWNLRKVQILNAAIVQLAEKGIVETSYDTLAKALHLGRSHIVYYFPDKESLFLEVIQFVAATAQKVTIEAVASVERSEVPLTVVSSAFDWAERFPHQARLMVLFYYFSSMNSAYKKLHSEIRLIGRRRLAQAIGGHRAEAQAIAVQALVTGMLIEAFTVDEKGVGLKEVRARCLKAVKEVLSH